MDKKKRSPSRRSTKGFWF